MAIHEQQQIRHELAEAESFVGAEGVLTVDKTKQVVRVHDGVNPGGTPLAREDLANVPTATLVQRGAMSPSHVNTLQTISAGATNTAANIEANRLAGELNNDAIQTKQDLAEKDQPEGYAGLDAEGKSSHALLADLATESADFQAFIDTAVQAQTDNTLSGVNTFTGVIQFVSAAIRGKFAGLTPRITQYLNFDVEVNGDATYSETNAAAVINTKLTGTPQNPSVELEIEHYPVEAAGEVKSMPASVSSLILPSEGNLEFNGNEIKPVQQLRLRRLPNSQTSFSLAAAGVVAFTRVFSASAPFRGLSSGEDLIRINPDEGFNFTGTDTFDISSATVIDLEFKLHFDALNSSIMPVTTTLLAYLEFDGVTRTQVPVSDSSSTRVAAGEWYMNATLETKEALTRRKFVNTQTSGPAVILFSDTFKWENVDVSGYGSMQIRLQNAVEATATIIPQSLTLTKIL